MSSFAAELEEPAQANKGELIRTGYLEKQGEIVRSYKNRYFRLWSNYILEYFKDQSSSKSSPKGMIDLSSTLNMTKSGDKEFEIECPSRIWKFKTKTEFSRESWFDSIFMVWKGINHKQDAQKKNNSKQQEKINHDKRKKEYGYNNYNYNYNQNVNNGPDLEMEEGANINDSNNNDKVYPNLKIKNNKRNKEVDQLWGDKQTTNNGDNDDDEDEEENDEGAYQETKKDVGGDVEPGANDSSYGLLSGVPKAPNGFEFHRVCAGDTLVKLSVKYGLSQNKIKQYNNDICFGHRLGHISGKLILIPVSSNAVLTDNLKKELSEIYKKDNEYNLDNLDEKEYDEPDDNGKYILRKALMYHAKGLDQFRCDYYLNAAKWNVRKALKLWKADDVWEKQQKLMKQCDLKADEAIILLQNFNFNLNEAIAQRKKYGNKLVLNNIELQNGKDFNPLMNIKNNDDNQQMTNY